MASLHHNTIGPLLIIGFDGAEISPRLASLLKRIQPAGVVLFARNIQTPQQTWQLLSDCRKCVAEPLFTCVDMEGGLVDRFRETFGPTPAAAEVYATGDRKLFRKHGEIIGEGCRALGFNVNFAPALDLAWEASRNVMGSRAVSADPKEVVKYAREFLRGLADKNVIGSGKHFPGLGEGKLDSHHDLPIIQKPYRRMWQQDLVPYRSLRKELPMVMVSHGAFPALTTKPIPASLSPRWITDVLRKTIGYRGLIVSDDLEMGGVLKAAPLGESAVQFVGAGGDLALVCHLEERVTEAFEALARAYGNDAKFRSRADEAAANVARFKKRYDRQLRAATMPTEKRIGSLTRNLWEFGEAVRYETIA
jgi:beta-N-acetylhexosaminidase